MTILMTSGDPILLEALTDRYCAFCGVQLTVWEVIESEEYDLPPCCDACMWVDEGWIID